MITIQVVVWFLFLVCLLVLYPHSIRRQERTGEDYPIFYDAARNRGEAKGYLYPPFFAWIISPLARLPLRTSSRTWYLLQGLIILVILWYCIPDVRFQNIQHLFIAIIFIVAVARLVKLNMELGQVNGLVLLLLLIAIQTTNATVLGVSIGLATAIKLSPVLFLPYAMIQSGQNWIIVLISFLITILITATLPLLSGYKFSGFGNLKKMAQETKVDLGLYKFLGTYSHLVFLLLFVASIAIALTEKSRWEILLIPTLFIITFPIVRKAHLLMGMLTGLLILTPMRVIPLVWSIGTLGTIFWQPSAILGNLIAILLLFYYLMF